MSGKERTCRVTPALHPPVSRLQTPFDFTKRALLQLIAGMDVYRCGVILLLVLEQPKENTLKSVLHERFVKAPITNQPILGLELL